MRYLILSDLHANLEALEAVMEEAEGRYDQIVCCGDLVGYGADPNAVTEWVQGRCTAVIRGNHDKVCTGLDDLEWFNPVARTAIIWTREQLNDENCAYVRSLPKGPLPVETFELAHGSPFDEDEYVTTAAEAAGAFEYLDRRLAFFGHTHVQGGFIWNHARVEKIPSTSARTDRQVVELDPGCAYLINPGSVGQPRDGDPRAAFATYDSDAGMITYFRVTYDIATAQRKIREAGLPPALANRLAQGR